MHPIARCLLRPGVSPHPALSLFLSLSSRRRCRHPQLSPQHPAHHTCGREPLCYILWLDTPASLSTVLLRTPTIPATRINHQPEPGYRLATHVFPSLSPRFRRRHDHTFILRHSQSVLPCALSSTLLRGSVQDQPLCSLHGPLSGPSAHKRPGQRPSLVISLSFDAFHRETASDAVLMTQRLE